MSIIELGALGECVGAIAVVGTLIYLAIQLRHTTQIHAYLIRHPCYDATQRQILHAVRST